MKGLVFCICVWRVAVCFCVVVLFFKQKTAYEMRISDWSSDVCSSDLAGEAAGRVAACRWGPDAASSQRESCGSAKSARRYDRPCGGNSQTQVTISESCGSTRSAAP